MLHTQHARVCVARNLGQRPLKHRKEGRVIECPFRSVLTTISDQHLPNCQTTYLVVPFLDGQ